MIMEEDGRESNFMVNRLCQKAKFYIFAPLYQSTVIARPRSLAV